jgi:hypothetical protein
MNERIKELAIQAGFFYEDYKDIWYLEYHNQTCEEEMKKFAELIVQECAGVAQDFVTVENNKLVEHVHISPWHLQDKIKEHFGVE